MVQRCIRHATHLHIRVVVRLLDHVHGSLTGREERNWVPIRPGDGEGQDQYDWVDRVGMVQGMFHVAVLVIA
jgi:hypothetical protein